MENKDAEKLITLISSETAEYNSDFERLFFYIRNNVYAINCTGKLCISIYSSQVDDENRMAYFESCLLISHALNSSVMCVCDLHCHDK